MQRKVTPASACDLPVATDSTAIWQFQEALLPVAATDDPA
jgi:hypothetical protein